MVEREDQPAGTRAVRGVCICGATLGSGWIGDHRLRSKHFFLLILPLLAWTGLDWPGLGFTRSKGKVVAAARNFT